MQLSHWSLLHLHAVNLPPPKVLKKIGIGCLFKTVLSSLSRTCRLSEVVNFYNCIILQLSNLGDHNIVKPMSIYLFLERAYKIQFFLYLL